MCHLVTVFASLTDRVIGNTADHMAVLGVCCCHCRNSCKTVPQSWEGMCLEEQRNYN